MNGRRGMDRYSGFVPPSHARRFIGQEEQEGPNLTEELDSYDNQDAEYGDGLSNGMINPPQPGYYRRSSRTFTYTTNKGGSGGVNNFGYREIREADSTGEDKQIIQRVVNNEGITIERNRNSDGRVETRQFLHNHPAEEASRGDLELRFPQPPQVPPENNYYRRASGNRARPHMPY